MPSSLIQEDSAIVQANGKVFNQWRKNGGKSGHNSMRKSINSDNSQQFGNPKSARSNYSMTSGGYQGFGSIGGFGSSAAADKGLGIFSKGLGFNGAFQNTSNNDNGKNSSGSGGNSEGSRGSEGKSIKRI